MVVSAVGAAPAEVPHPEVPSDVPLDCACTRNSGVYLRPFVCAVALEFHVLHDVIRIRDNKDWYSSFYRVGFRVWVLDFL